MLRWISRVGERGVGKVLQSVARTGGDIDENIVTIGLHFLEAAEPVALVIVCNMQRLLDAKILQTKRGVSRVSQEARQPRRGSPCS